MNAIILDPTDPTRAFIGSASEARFGAHVGAATLTNVHSAGRCAGRVCIIHAPTDHHMRGWELHWRDDMGLFERICPDGVGHPDPDQFNFWRSMGMIGLASHSCDDCCARPE